MPWLIRGRHIGHLSRALDRLGVTDADWTATDLLDALARYHRAHERYSIPPSHQRSPIGLLVTQLQHVLAGEAETPGARRRRLTAERERRAEQERARLAAVEANRATPDQVRARAAEARAKVLAAARKTKADARKGPLVELRPRAW